MDMKNPEPWLYPGQYHLPKVTAGDGPVRVEVGLPNEEPGEDDRTVLFTFTHEGLIVDGYVSDGQPVGTSGQTYEEIYDGTIEPVGDPVWASDPDHPVEDWQYEVANGDTRRGYQEWLQARREGS